MSKKIDHIIKNGKAENAAQEAKQSFYALFHQNEKEEEVIGAITEELGNFEPVQGWNRDYNKMFARLWNKLERREKKTIPGVNWLQALKIAAVLLIGLAIGAYVNSLRNTPIPVFYEAHSPKGSVADIIFPDGTVVFLNADSRIKYGFDEKNGLREITLDGEAWFNVGKDRTKPFIVHTSFYDVKVTGTVFNVKAYSSDAQLMTTLEEGEVRIASTDNFKLTHELIMKPGEQVVLNKETREMLVKTVNTKQYTAWKDNKLIFLNMNMDELIVTLQRKYGVEIVVENKKLLDLHFNGTIKNETIIEILEILKSTLPVDYKIEGQKVIITNKKK